MANPERWTDEEVRNYLVTNVAPLDRCRVSIGLYGYIDDRGEPYLVMDDDDERSDRVIRYLKKAGAAELNS